MELEYYLSPVKKLLNSNFTVGSLFESVHFLHDQETNHSPDIFILSTCTDTDKQFVLECRNLLYRLYPRHRVEICDCGHLVQGKTKEDTDSALTFVYETLMQFNKPIILIDCIASIHPLTLYLKKGNSNISIASNRLSFSGNDISDINRSAGTVLNYLESQIYLSSEKNYEETVNKGDLILRHGQLLNNLFLAEPCLRDSDAFFIDLTVLAGSIMESSVLGSVNGADGHAICQYSYYFGRSEKATMLSFTTPFTVLSKERTNYYADIVAQSIWHFIVGKNQEHSFYFNSSSYKSYHLDNIQEGIEFCFFEDLATAIWWLSIGNGQQEKIIASSRNEYLQMINGDISDHILRAISFLQ